MNPNIFMAALPRGGFFRRICNAALAIQGKIVYNIV